VVYVILAFPRGRLETTAAREIFVAVAVDVAVLYLPLVPLVRFFPHPFPWGGCNAGCPPNAFFAGQQRPRLPWPPARRQGRPPA
jgi:hypothetical protein